MNKTPPLEAIILRQIMGWKKPAKKDIASIFGKDTVDAFDYAYRVFKGQKRTDCDNPAIAHSFDVAYWVKVLGLKYEMTYPNFSRIINCAFLHDTIEDRSATIENVEDKFKDILRKFGEETAKDVLIMTDIYSIIINDAEKKSGHKNNKKAIISTINLIYNSLDSSLKDRYGPYFKKILQAAEEITPYQTRKLRKENPLFTYVDCLKFKCYGGCYIGGIIQDAKKRMEKGQEDYDLCIIVKLADGIDSVRTNPPTKTYSGGKIVKKAEIKIDSIGECRRMLKKEGKTNIFVEKMTWHLKNELFEQIERRIRGNDELNDERYSFVKEFFKKQHERLAKKYKFVPGQTGFQFN